ncbi:RND transporter [Comamonas serinivorans]|uniref:RND transporter n=1 Tax=Comamonas serinivorans TaxID=1082851 RepID=A0A1Y0EL30_9BURK|nr:efflux transporter outer membrane subunit [Comamonas serinivorans]ARU04343.1 RND transporter [Comamonas serinivorans]
MLKAATWHAVAAATCLLVTGCAVGPDFQRPDIDAVPAAFARQAPEPGPGAAALTITDVRDAAFWRQFGDEELTALVQQALRSNHDVAGMLARLQAAESMLSLVRKDRLPTVTLNGQLTQQRLSADQLGAGQAPSTRSHSVGLAASWELDLVGRVRRSIEAQEAQTQASRADLVALQVAIAVQVADTYTQLRGTQLRLKIVQTHAQNQQHTAELVARRLHAGMGTDLDARRSVALLRSTQARVPELQAQVAQLQHRLAVLSGLSPEHLIAQLEEIKPLPIIPPSVQPDTPANVLRRRPDVAAAEARLHAATARIGVATSDLFPRLSIGGLLGSFAFEGSRLFDADRATRQVVLGIDWSFLDVGRVRARIAASEAGAQEALAQYQQTVLLALEETENALVRAHRSQETWRAQLAAMQQRDEAAHLAERMYRGGTLSMFEVLEAQRDQLTTQEATADSQISAVRASLALYATLAGGWPGKPARPVTAQTGG